MPPSQREAIERLQGLNLPAGLRPLFAALASSPAVDLFEIAELRAGDIVLQYRDSADPGPTPGAAIPAQPLVIVVDGFVQIHPRSASGRVLTPLIVGPGAWVGRCPITTPIPWPLPVNTFARAVTPVTVLRLRRDAGNDAHLAELAPVFRFMELKARVLAGVVFRLRRFDAFRDLSNEALVPFVMGARLQTWTDAHELLAAGEVPTQCWFVLSGSVECRREVPGLPTTVTEFGVGDWVAEAPFLVQAPSLETWTAAPGAELATISIEDYQHFLSNHPRALRALSCPPPPDSTPIVTFLAHDRTGVPLVPLAALVVRTLREETGDHVVDLRVARGDSARRAWSEDGRRCDVVVPEGDDPASAVRRALGELRERRIDIALLHPSTTTELMEKLASEIQVWWFADDPRDAPTSFHHAPTTRRVALLRPVGRTVGPWPPGTVRVRIDAERLRRWERSPDAWEREGTDRDETARAVRRLGRAVTQRLVGVALGGGGSPGFAHVSLLRALRAGRSVPIDFIAGSSFGALVAAWYAAEHQLGRIHDGPLLQSMIDSGAELSASMALGIFNTRPMQYLVDRKLEGLTLDDLEVPFFPITSEVESATLFTVRSATLGAGVRASGAFPPMFPAVFQSSGQRLCDGGFVNNVPANPLRGEGANVVIASNSIGIRPADHHAPPPRGHLGRAIASLNPVRRYEDTMRALMLLFHRVGDAETMLADFAYEASYTSDQIWNFSVGEQVIAETRAETEAFAAAVKTAMWNLPVGHMERIGPAVGRGI